MIKYGLRFLATIILSFMLAATLGCSPGDYSRFEETREMMGTFVNIIVYAQDSGRAEKAMGSAFEKISQIEAIATIFDDESEASALNANANLSNPSEHMSVLITEAKNYNQISGGAFDITVQPVLELWQAGLWKETEEVQQEMIGQAMELVGSDKITVSQDSIELKEGMRITLGGIAKGYAVDRAMEVLKQEGINFALINAGGDIMTTGPKPDGSYWAIALEDPDGDDSIAVINVANKAVATSGNYERYFDPDREAHHIIDPRTGYSSEGSISATIISNSCMDADALATSIFVLGPERGIDLVNRLDGVEALLIDEDRNIHRSNGLSKYIKN